MRRLCDRYPKALVTGASSGLGAAFTTMLLEEGVEVWGTARDTSRLTARPGFHPVALDLLDPVSLAQVAEEVMGDAGMALLINNAGAGVFAATAGASDATLDEALALMLQAPVTLGRLLWPHFIKRGGGCIVNVSSLAVRFPLPCLAAYNAAKAGLSAYTQTLLLESARSPVRVIDFQPGDYRTGFNQATRHEQPLSDASGMARRAWEALEQHMASAPSPDHAARVLRRALLRGKSGTVRAGGFFQAVVGPGLANLCPEPLVRGFLRGYYRL
jgi:short-subunit dehydrogenase